jgi:hypothetical protein
VGLELGDEAAVAMERHLAEKPKGHKGEHRYDFDHLGLDRDAERARFARYCARFDVPAEA